MPGETHSSLGLGLIGCGGFGRFCLEAYRKLPGIRPAAVADVVRSAAEQLGAEFDVPAHGDPHELIARDDVDVVHVATPPSSHHELVLAAIGAGNHVLCEKPLAMNTAEADEMLAAARSAGVIAAVNFVLRYNRVTDAVKAVLDSGAMGRPLAVRLTNCASDSKLGPDHWFWDTSVSGGIFIEHGVHFFDLYRHWFGPGRVTAAHAETREGTTQEDRVTCTVRHNTGVVASHYHGFDQVGPMDRTDHRVVCELGDVRVQGWIPLTLRIDAALDDVGAEALHECFEDVEGVRFEQQPEVVETAGRGKPRRLTRRVQVEYTPQPDKQAAYADSVVALLADQVAFIRNPSHPRVITESNGVDAVRLAQAAAELAAASSR